MKIKNSKNNGLTLIETLIVLALGAMLMLNFFIWQRENALNQNAKMLGLQMVTILNGIDQKIAMAGYSVTDTSATGDAQKVWQMTNYTATYLVIDNLLRRELIARDSVCGAGDGWLPSKAKDTKTNLVPCMLWNNKKIPFDFLAQGKVVVDADGFVSDVYVILIFQNQDLFKKNISYAMKAIDAARANDSVNQTGRHVYVVANRNQLDGNGIPREVSGVNSCYAMGYNNCVIMLRYSRNNSYEYLRTDGTNSMLNTTVSFKKNKTSERMKCNRWYKDTTGAWTLEDTVDCGMGVYKPADSTSAEAKAGNEDNVQIVVDYSTQKEVHMDKSCAVFQVNYNSTGTADVISESNVREPCGILNKKKENKDSTDPLPGDVVYQLVDRVTAEQGYFKDLYGRKLYIEDSSFIRGDLNVIGDAVVQGSTSVGQDLTVGGATAVQGDLGVGSDARVSGNTTALGGLNVEGQTQLAGQTLIKGSVDVRGNAGVTKNLTVSGNAEINGKSYYRNGLKVQGGAEANSFLPNLKVTYGNLCAKADLGKIAQDTNTGNALSCMYSSTTGQYRWGTTGSSATYACLAYKNCNPSDPQGRLHLGVGTPGAAGSKEWQYCGFMRVGNLEDSHYCAISNGGTTTAPIWYMTGYKGGCTAYCIDF